MMPAAADFVLFGIDHMVVLVLAVAVPAALILWARLSGSQALSRRIRWTLAVLLVGNEVGYWCYGLATNGPLEYLARFLPLHLCGMAVFVTAWALVRPNQVVCELAYFWGLAGTLQAIITPEIKVGFPDYRCIEFFTNHIGIVAGAMFVVLAMGWRPRPGCIGRMFWLTNAAAAVAGLADWMIGHGANYMYMCEPPLVSHPLFFLPWPWYLLLLEVVGVIIMSALYLPFRIGRRRPGPPDFA